MTPEGNDVVLTELLGACPKSEQRRGGGGTASVIR